MLVTVGLIARDMSGQERDLFGRLRAGKKKEYANILPGGSEDCGGMPTRSGNSHSEAWGVIFEENILSA